MFAKSALAAIALVVAAPAFAAGVNPGTEMIAKLVNVDANEFTVNELAQIAAEKGSVKQQERANYIASQKARGVSTAVAEDSSSTYFGLNASQRVGRDD